MSWTLCDRTSRGYAEKIAAKVKEDFKIDLNVDEVQTAVNELAARGGDRNVYGKSEEEEEIVLYVVDPDHDDLCIMACRGPALVIPFRG